MTHTPGTDLELSGYWEEESFVPHVDSILGALSLPITKAVVDSRRVASQFLVSKREWVAFRRVGLYFPPSDMAVWDDCRASDRLPVEASAAFLREPGNEAEDWGDYCCGLWVKRAALPAAFRPQMAGPAYRILIVQALPDGRFVPSKMWATVGDDGKFHAALSDIVDWSPYGRPSRRQVGDDGKTAGRASITIQLLDDRQRLWIVSADDGVAVASFGVRIEQIQSLLYARDSPMSASGRRRPILHWVEAHQRRLKNGTEVRIPAHIRGVSEITMGGTQFCITEPQKPTRAERAMKVSPLPAALVFTPPATGEVELPWWRRAMSRLKSLRRTRKDRPC